MLKSIIKSYIIDYALNLILEKYQNEFSVKEINIHCIYMMTMNNYILVAIPDTHIIMYIRYKNGYAYSVNKNMKYSYLLLKSNITATNPIVNIKVKINRLNNYESIALQVINYMRNENLTELRNLADKHIK